MCTFSYRIVLQSFWLDLRDATNMHTSCIRTAPVEQFIMIMALNKWVPCQSIQLKIALEYATLHPNPRFFFQYAGGLQPNPRLRLVHA